ncbi:type II toxin-antitoxin system VapC family toxin [Gloeothece verrucosa]|uniref:PilT protein domain protein n=1 Tax=Gloeothece verrucosa (strain PCC 7822) TaxID=497965 RepID=E0UG19_GLOV7|nr:type II toxin-antitoxin system VapC family toxin [Gloeothece verrucosa]ADN15520.1 PilT protein domain protein [Gloeothece verrucosa PCC 7822]
MSLRYLLDTNILSEIPRKSPNANVMAKLEEHQREIATAAIVLDEIIYGCNCLPPSKKRQNIEKFINNVILPRIPILPYNTEAAMWHGVERARLKKMGKTRPFADGQIAAIAYVNNLIIVTNNVSDFDGFKNLQVENWHLDQ